MTSAGTGEWYWCMEHERAEEAGSACAPDNRLGPYGSREEATHWKDKVEARNDKWEEEDRRWEGDADE